MAQKASADGEGGEETNDISKAYDAAREMKAVASEWENELQDRGSIGARVSGSGGPSGNFERGWYAGGGPVTVSKTFTIPMDVPAYLIKQMEEDLEAAGADVEIDMKASVTGRPPKQKESGVVVPRGPTAEQIEAMDEDDKTHTGVVTVTMDVTDQMQGLPDDLIVEGSRVAKIEDVQEDAAAAPIYIAKSYFSADKVYIYPADGQPGPDTERVHEDDLALINQQPSG